MLVLEYVYVPFLISSATVGSCSLISSTSRGFELISSSSNESASFFFLKQLHRFLHNEAIQFPKLAWTTIAFWSWIKGDGVIDFPLCLPSLFDTRYNAFSPISSASFSSPTSSFIFTLPFICIVGFTLPCFCCTTCQASCVKCFSCPAPKWISVPCA